MPGLHSKAYQDVLKVDFGKGRKKKPAPAKRRKRKRGRKIVNQVPA